MEQKQRVIDYAAVCDASQVISQAREMWREGKSHDFASGYGDTMLRVKPGEPDYIETSDGYTIGERVARRIFDLCRAAREPGFKGPWSREFRDTQGGGAWRVTVTHRGDARVGCTLLRWDEIYEFAETQSWL